MESDGESVDGSGSEADSEESTRLASEDELPQENSDDQTFLDLDTLTGPPPPLSPTACQPQKSASE